MPVPVSPASWTGSLLWLVAVLVAAFLVSWLAADRLTMARARYIGVLTLMTAGLSAGYVAWLGVGVVDLLMARWGWGLVAAPVIGVVLALGLRRVPVYEKLHGRRLAVALLWEGAVYGLAEGVLLSALPVLITWQLIHSLGWSGPAGGVARWTLPVLASAAVILVHHLGYWEYRNRLLAPITLGCGLMSLGYLVTGSPIAPTLAHVIGHAAMLRHGGEMPPHPRGAPPASYGLVPKPDRCARCGRPVHDLPCAVCGYDVIAQARDKVIRTR